MTSQFIALGWTLVLALVQIFLPAGFRNRETGVEYNAGPRDGPAPPPGVVTARLQRAQANLYETLPLYAAGLIIAHLAGRDGAPTLWGAWLYLLARIVYVPLYGFGVPMVRSLAWGLSVLALLLLLFAILRPA